MPPYGFPDPRTMFPTERAALSDIDTENKAGGAGRAALDAYADVPPSAAQYPAQFSAPPAAGGALPNNVAQAGPPTSQARGGYPPAPPKQASSQGQSAAAPFTAGSLMEETHPVVIYEALNASAESVAATAKKNPDSLKQVDATLTLKGVDTEKAFNDLRDNMLDKAAKSKSDRNQKVYNEPEFRKGWKRIFNNIPRDQMGLFLMDFGMRMMAGSNQNTFVNMGQAGSGALAGMQERQRFAGEVENRDEQQALAEEQYADKQAGALIGMDQQERQIGIEQARANSEIENRGRISQQDVLTTDQGLYVGSGIGPDGNRQVSPLIGSDGQRLTGRTTGDNGKEYESDRRYRRMREAGRSHARAVEIIEGAPTEGQLRSMGRQEFGELIKGAGQYGKMIPPGSKTAKPLSQWTDKERGAWLDQYVRESLPREGDDVPLSPDEVVRSSRRPQRPKGIDTY